MDGISGWGGGMTATSSCASCWLDAEDPKVDASRCHTMEIP